MTTCAAFEAEATDLALGFTDAPARDRLLAHAAECGPCRRLLNDLGSTADLLLELAPEVEPPVGFEARAVAAMGRQGRRRTRRWRVGVGGAAAAVALVLVGVAATLVAQDGGRADEAVAAPIIASGDGGATIGRVELVRSPRPRVVVLVDGPGDWSGTWGCELRRPDGRWVEVGRWTAADASAGVWATRIAEPLLDATAMRITGTGGRVLATADLD